MSRAGSTAPVSIALLRFTAGRETAHGKRAANAGRRTYVAAGSSPREERTETGARRWTCQSARGAEHFSASVERMGTAGVHLRIVEMIVISKNKRP